MDSEKKGERVRRVGVMVLLFGLGLISGLAVGRSVTPATPNPATMMLPSDSMWAVDGPVAQLRDQQMDEMAEMLKETLELDPEQEVEFDRLQARVKGDMEGLMREVGPQVAETVMGAASDLRAILTEEQLERLNEIPMPMAPMMFGPRPPGFPGGEDR